MRSCAELKEFFPGQMTPPVVFVEWSAAPQAEIELIAQLPPTDKPAQDLEYYNPPDTRPLPIFSRVALVRSQRQIYIPACSPVRRATARRRPATCSPNSRRSSTKRAAIMRHLVKASYYVCDPDAGRGYDRVRPKVLDPKRPPAASLIMVHGVGKSGRTLTMDMIAVGSGK